MVKPIELHYYNSETEPASVNYNASKNSPVVSNSGPKFVSNLFHKRLIKIEKLMNPCSRLISSLYHSVYTFHIDGIHSIIIFY
jgi:hypothetical protein